MKIAKLMRFCVAAALAAAALHGTHVQAQASGQPAAPAAVPAAPVTMPVTVVDKKGDPVKNLTAADVTLTDNGHIQTIESFGPAQPRPMTLAILGQTSMNMKTELGDARLATVHFVDHTLPGTDDKFFVIQFAKQVDLLEDPTGDTNKLHDAINQLGSPQFGSQNSGNSDSSGSDDESREHRYGGAGGTLYDAIYLAAMEVMKKQPGQHVLVLFTDGVDRDSKESQNDAVEAAQAAHAQIFAVYYKGEEERPAGQNPGGSRRGGMGGSYPGGGGGYPGGGGGYPGGGGGRRGGGGQAPSEGPHIDGREILEHMCNATGGYMVEAKRDKAEEAYNRILALLKNQYALRYTPDKDASESVSHHLTLTVKKNDIWTIVQQDYATTQ